MCAVPTAKVTSDTWAFSPQDDGLSPALVFYLEQRIRIDEGGMAQIVDRDNQPVLISDAAPAMGEHRDLTILVIDDEEPIRLLIQDLLQLEGYAVLLAWNGKLGLTCAQKCHPDLILTDIMMPIMDGYELSRNLHADPDTAQIPVIAMSAAFQQRYAGLFSAVIAKPFELLPLLTLIDTHLGDLM